MKTRSEIRPRWRLASGDSRRRSAVGARGVRRGRFAVTVANEREPSQLVLLTFCTERHREGAKIIVTGA